MSINYGLNNISTSGNINVSGVITATSGNFTNLLVNGNSFNTSVSGLLPTIANSGDNRILTSTGTSTGINAESNATFDGTNLNVSGIFNIDNIRIDTNTISSTNSNGDILILPTGIGKVGIGTNNPTAKLHIVLEPNVTNNIIQSTGNNTLLSLQTYPTADRAALRLATYNAVSAPQYSFTADTDTGMAGGFIADNLQIVTSGIERIRINQIGNVGIGTSSPTQLLDIRGNVYASGNVGIGTSTPSGALHVVGTGLFCNTTGIVPNALLHTYSATSGATIFNVEGTNGSLFSVIDNLSGTLMSVNNNAGLPVFEVFSDDKIVAGRFNQNDFVLSSGGNLGLGTASPSNKLDVIGNAYISGVLTSVSGSITTLTTVPTVVSPSALSTNQGDWNPGSGDIVRMSATSGISISGIVLGSEYTRVLINVGSSNNITLKHQASGATAANRIITSTGGDHIVPPTGAVTILYDSVDSRWRVL